MRPTSFSIFFPMYNERANIELLLAEVEMVIPTLGFDDYEILFIDDGSTDGCDRLIEERALTNGRIRLVRHPHNMGYGSALRTGFLEASKEIVFYTDSDLPVQLTDIARALPLLEEADVVIGYRVARYDTPRRAVYSWVYNRLIRLLFGVRVRDVNFSFKMVHRRALNCITLDASTVFIDGQILAEAHRYGFTIAELPVVYIPRKFGRSNFDSLRTAWETFCELVGYWLRSHPRKEIAPIEAGSLPQAPRT